MKKKYVVLIPNITGMGGAQMYVRNKLLYMQENGWDIDLISAHSGKVYIEELRQYDYFVPEFIFNYYLFSLKKRLQIVNDLVKRVLDKKYDEIFIESTCIPTCTWGEVIAEKCSARHFCYLLQEDNTINSEQLLKYFVFKYKRHELASITEKSLYFMFKSILPISISDSTSMFLPAYCNNVTEDIDSEWLNIIDNYKCDYKVGCLSRLNKPFIIPILSEFIKYAELHSDKHFLLMMIGGADISYSKKIYKMFAKVSNVKLLITDYLFPIPSRLLERFDALFTSAGSAWVCMRSGVPTISIDGKDFKPIGILGRTTDNSVFRDNSEPTIDFFCIMDDVLFNKRYKKINPSHEYINPDFKSHDDFMSKMMINEKTYYSFNNMFFSMSDKKLSFLLNCISAKNYYKISMIINKIRFLFGSC